MIVITVLLQKYQTWGGISIALMYPLFQKYVVVEHVPVIVSIIYDKWTTTNWNETEMFLFVSVSFQVVVVDLFVYRRF